MATILKGGNTTYGGGSVVTDDIKLLLDAANDRSYPLSGTTWFNLAPTNEEDFSMIGGISHETNNAGVMNLSASGDRAQSATTAFFPTPTSMSVFAWFKLTGNAGAFRTVVHKGSAASVGSSVFWVGANSSNQLVATIGANSGAVGTYNAGNTGITSTLDEWFNLGATWDGATVRVYLNGEYKLQYALASFTNPTNNTIIGAASTSTTYQVLGDVANVSLYYNRVLSGTEVLGNFSALKNRFI